MRSLILSLFIVLGASIVSSAQVSETCSDSQMPANVAMGMPNPDFTTTISFDPTWITNSEGYTPSNLGAGFTTAYFSFTVDNMQFYTINVQGAPGSAAVGNQISVSLDSDCLNLMTSSEVFADAVPSNMAPEDLGCVSLSPGTTYTIALAMDPSLIGDVIITIVDAIGSTNISCATASPMVVGANVGNNACSSGLVWYSYTVAEGGDVSLTASVSTTGDDILNPVITQTSIDNCVSFTADTDWTCLPIGTVINFEVGDDTAPIEEGNFNVDIVDDATGIINEVCADVTPVMTASCVTTTLTDGTNNTTVGACQELLDFGTCGVFNTESTVWFGFTTDADAQTVDIEVTPAGFTFVLIDGTTGCPAGVATVAGCQTMGSLSGQMISANTTYYVAVATSSAGTDGVFTLTVTPENPPSNDECATGALDISLASADPANTGVSGTTACATPDLNDFCATVSEDHVVYYEYTVDPSILTNRDVIITIQGDAINGSPATSAIFGLFEDCVGTAYMNPAFSGDECDALLGAVTYKCVEPGTVLTIAVGSADGGEGDFTITITEDASMLAINDACADATGLSVGVSCVPTLETVPNNGGCPEVDDLSTSCLFSSDKTVWHTITLPAAADQIEFTALGTDVQLALFENSCAPLTLLGGDCFTTDETFTGLTPGGTYLLAASLAGAIEGDMTFTWTPGIEVTNDDCDAMMNPALTNGTPVDGTTACADGEFDFCGLLNGTSHGVFYTYTNSTGANVDLDITISANTATSGTAITGLEIAILADCIGTLYQPEDCSAALNAAYNVDCISPGDQIIIYIASNDTEEGDFSITVTEDTTQPTDNNDNCADALSIDAQILTTCDFYSISGSTADACPENFDVGGCTYSTDATVWYSFTTPVTTNPLTVEIQSIAGVSGAYTTIFTNDCASPVVIGGCDTGAGPFGPYTIMPNTTYLIAVGDGAEGAHSFEIQINELPVNDDPCMAEAVTGTAGDMNITVSGTTVCATTDYLEPSCGADNENTVWYEYTVPSDATGFEISIAGTGGNPASSIAVGAFETTACGGGTPTLLDGNVGVECDTEANPVSFQCLTPGTTVFVYVGTSDANSGTFDITFDPLVPDPTCIDNDLCADADAASFASLVTDGGQVCIDDCNAGACPEAFTSGACDYSMWPTVFYSVTTDALAIDATMSVSLAGINGTMADPIFSIYTSCAAGAVDPASECIESGTLTGLDIMPNTTYIIAVALEDADGGEFQLCVTVSTTCNDDPCTPYELTEGVMPPECTTTVGATDETFTYDNGGCADVTTSEATVYFTYIPSEGVSEATITFTNDATNGIAGDMIFTVVDYDVASCDMEQVTILGQECGPAGGIMPITVTCPTFNEPILIQIGSTTAGAGEFDIVVNETLTSVPNDICSSPDNTAFAAGLACEWMDAQANSVGACPESFDFAPQCGFDDFPVVWFEATAPAGATGLDIRLVGAIAGVPFLGVFEGNPVDCSVVINDQLFGCQSGAFTDLDALGQMLIDVMPGDVILIGIGTDDASGSATIDFSIKWNVPPVNDECDMAITLLDNAAVDGSTACATQENPFVASAACDVVNQENTVWYEVTVPPGSKGFTFMATATAMNGFVDPMNVMVFETASPACDISGGSFVDDVCVNSGDLDETFECVGEGTYIIRLSTSGDNEGDFQVVVDILDVDQPNDHCLDAIVFDPVLECEWMDVVANTVDACPESFDFTPECGSDEFPVVWFEATAPAGATNLDIRVTAAGSSTPFIAAFEGNPISCDVPDIVNLTNCIEGEFDDLVMAGETLVDVLPGDVILFAVWTDDPAGTTIDFSIKFIVAPLNDECVDGEVVPNGVATMGTTTCATPENPLFVSGACSVDNQENTVWYEFTVPDGVNGFDLTLTAAATDGFIGNANIVIFESTVAGCVADNSTFVDDVCAASATLVEDFECIGPGTYVIRISTSELNEGDFEILIEEYTSPVVNDLCSNPIAIVVEPECEWYPVDANTVDACPEQFDFASDCGFDDFPVVWYEINVTNDNATEIQINLISSASGNAFYSVFNGNPADCIDLIPASVSGFCESTLGENTVPIDIEANGPQTYLIGVGADAANGSASIQFEIKVIVPPDNDEPCDAELVLTAGDVDAVLMGTTVCATMDLDDFVCDLQDENSVWYEYTIPAGTTGFIVTLTESGDGQDFAVGVYDFPNGCLMNPVFLDPDIQTNCGLEDGDELKFTCLEEGTTAWIMVSTLDAEAGDFELIIDPIVPDPLCIDNDLCDMADDGSTISTPVTDGGQVCVADCNFEACPEEFFAGACLYNEFPTVFYTVTTDADAEDATMSVILSSADGNPIFSVFEFDCDNPTAVSAESFCVEGDGASANLSNMEVDANTTYIIVVALDEIDEEGGDFELCVNVTTSCNDDPCSPYPLVPGDGVNSIALDCDNNIGATEEPFDYVTADCDDPLLFASTVYFSYTVPDNISSFTLFYTNDPTEGIQNVVGINIMVYDAANCAFEQVEIVAQQCTQPGNVDAMEVDCPTSGDTYLIQITSAEGDEGEFDIEIMETIQDDPCAANDDCDFAMVLDVSETCEWLEFPDCNIQACPEEFFDPAMECAYDASAVVWYTFTTPANAVTAHIELVAGSVPDPTWGLFIDNGCAVPPTALNGDVLCVTTGGGPSALVEDIVIEENTTYYIAVGSETDIEGDFTLNIKIDVPPINDDPCINDDNPPLDLTGGGSHTGTTCCARGPKDENLDGTLADFNNVDCSAATEDAAVWYMFTPDPGDDGYNIILESGGSDPSEGPIAIEVYSGVPDQGCNGGFAETIGSSCADFGVEIKIGNCFAPGEAVFIKVSTGDADENCGEFTITVAPASCGPMADDCIDLADMTPIEPETSETFEINYRCITGCLDYACPEEDTNGGCPEFAEMPTVWFQVTADDIAAQMFTTVEPMGNWEPIWSVYSGPDCDNLAVVNFGGSPPCSNGDNTPELHQTSVFDDEENYWISITIDPASLPSTGLDDGSFELCVATTINAIICLGELEGGLCDDESLTMEITDREIEGQPLEGPFCQGEEITINISFFYDASESGADWLIGFVPIFGPGWDLDGFDFTGNAPTGNGQTAVWYEEDGDCAPILQEPNPILCTFTDDDGNLQLCNLLCSPCSECDTPGMAEGDPLPSGYFWVTDGSNAGCDNDCSPGEGWGIGSTMAQIDWTFTLPVKEFDSYQDCLDNNDLSISFQTFSDGTGGCWEDPVGECLLDRAMFSPPWQIECEAPPAVEGPDQELCHDGVTNIEVNTVDGSTNTIIVEVDDNPNVTGEMNQTFVGGTGIIMDDLTNLTDQVQIVIYNVYSEDETLPCPGITNQIEVTIYPELMASFPPVFVCEGNCTDISPDVFGGIGAPYTYVWSTGETTPSINVCPVVPTTYSVTVEDGLGCTDVAEIQVDVAPPVELMLPESIDVCKDDNYDPFNPDYVVCLEFLSGTPPYTVTWNAPPGLVLGNPFGSFGEKVPINELTSSAFGGLANDGKYIISVSVTDQFGCSSETDMMVNITGELLLVVDYFELECGDTEVDITATGFDAVGDPVTYFILYGGCPDNDLGDFLEDAFTTSGVVTFPTQDLLSYTCYTIVAETEAGCRTTQDITIPLTEGTPIDITGTPEVCIGEDATITITNEADFVTFEWTPDIGSTGSVTFTPDSTVTYFVEVTDATGCKSQEVFTVAVNDPPIISMVGTTTFCDGGTASVTASGGTIYTWTDSGGDTAGDTYTTGTPGMVTLVMQDANGCESDSTITFTQENIITISLGNQNICDGMGDTVFVSEDFINVEWYDATPTLVSDTNFYVVTGAGVFSVQALDGGTGCDAMGSFEVMDFMTPIISVTDTVEVCREDSGVDSLCVNFNNLVSGASGVWTQIDNITDFVFDPANVGDVCFEGIQAGCYAFVYTTNNAEFPCENVSDTLRVCVKACPCPSPVTEPIDPICNTVTTNLENAEITTDPGTWSVISGPEPDLTGIISGTIFDANGILPGNYVVRFTLDNPGGPACEEFTEQTITVFEAPTISAINGVMCNIDGQSDPIVLDLFTLLVGVDATDGGTWVQTADGTQVTITGGSTIMSADLAAFPETLTFVYTSEVEVGSPCPPAVATVEVLIRDCNCPFIDVLPDTLCNNGMVIDLNTLLINPDGLSGTWTTTGNLVGADMFDPSGLTSGLYTITFTLDDTPGPNCDVVYTDNILIRRQSVAVPTTADPPCSIDTGNGPTTTNLYDWLESNYSSGTWTQTGGTPELTFTDNGLDMAIVDFVGLPVGTEIIFTFSTNSALEPCTDISVEVPITVIDCNCPPIVITPAPDLCNDAGMLDLCDLTDGSDPGTYTVTTIGGTDVSSNITGCLFDASGLNPGEYVITFTLDQIVTGTCTQSVETPLNIIQYLTTDIEDPDQVCNDPDGMGDTSLDFTNSVTNSGIGTWEDTDGTGVAIGTLSELQGVSFIGVPAGTYTFTYTIDNVEPCEDVILTMEVVVVDDCNCPPINPLDPSDECNTDGPIDLTQYDDTDNSGTWSSTELTIENGNSLVIDGVASGSYTLLYTVDVITVDCDSTAEVQIFIGEPANAGTPAEDYRLCEEVVEVVDLTSLLDGEDLGGIWTETSATASTGFNSTDGSYTAGGDPAGTYTFEYAISENAPCPDVSAVVTVIIDPNPVADVGSANPIDCVNQTAELGSLNSTTGPDIEYTWVNTTTGEDVGNTAEITVTNPGLYELTVLNTATGCSDVGTIEVIKSDDLPTMIVEPKDITCFGFDDGGVTLSGQDGGVEPYTYSLNEGEITTDDPTAFNTLPADDYVIQIIDNIGCASGLYPFTISEPAVITVDAGPEIITGELGETFELTILPFDTTGITSIVWSDFETNEIICSGLDCTTITVTPTLTTTTYYVEVMNGNGCTAFDQVQIQTQQIVDVIFPNIISPNGDNINDNFFVKSKDVETVLSMKIFDRWGEKLYDASNLPPRDPSVGWDGKFKEKAVVPGVYVFIVEVLFVNGDVETFNGDVTVTDSE